MFQTARKAIVALVMAFAFILNHYVGIDLGFDEATMTALVDAAILIGGTAATYRIPNRPA